MLIASLLALITISNRVRRGMQEARS